MPIPVTDNDFIEERGLRVLVVSATRGPERWLDALRDRGYVCVVVQSAEEGAGRLKEGEFDLLLWDADADAAAFEREQQAGGPGLDLPTIVLAPRGSAALSAGTRRPAVIEQLVKPIEPSALVAAVEEALALTRARRLLGEVRRQVGEVTDALDEMEALLDRATRRRGGGRRGGRLPLSAREEEIARALARGHRVAEIARMFDISPHTVRNHFKAIFRKLDVHSQVQLVARLRGDA